MRLVRELNELVELIALVAEKTQISVFFAGSDFLTSLLRRIYAGYTIFRVPYLRVYRTVFNDTDIV